MWFLVVWHGCRYESAKERKLNSSLEGQVTVINPELAAYPGHLSGDIDSIPIGPPLYIDAGDWNPGELTQNWRETDRRKGEKLRGAL